jgi:dolichol-phosphate mannosyltransferase
LFNRKKIDLNKQEYSHESSYLDINDVTIIVPTLNEEQAISKVIDDLQVNGYENVIIVDGGSTDKTLEEVKKHKIEIIPQEGMGKTGAIATAIKHVNTPYFALLDGDCTYKGEDIENLIPYVRENVEVIGLRTEGRANIPLLNRFGNWGINAIFNTVFGTKLEDVCSGMYILSTDFAKEIPFQTNGFDVEVEIAAHASKKGTIKEVPIGYHPRVGQQKLHPFRDGVKIMSRIIKLGSKLHPFRMIYLLTILLMFPGLLLIGLTWQMDFLEQARVIGLIMITLAIQGLTLYLVDIRLKSFKH